MPYGNLHICTGTAAPRSYEVAVGRWVDSTVPSTPELALPGTYQSYHPGGLGATEIHKYRPSGAGS
eukprot:193821-Pleurochrysis_carterae.AAC.3